MIEAVLGFTLENIFIGNKQSFHIIATFAFIVDEMELNRENISSFVVF